MPEGVVHQIGAGLQAQLLVYLRTVGLHRLDREEYLLGYLLVREALGQKLEDLQLAVRELLVGAILFLSSGHKLLGEHGRHLRMDVAAALGHRMNGGDQLF